MKHLLLTITVSFFVCLSALANAPQIESTQVQKKLEELEKNFDGRIGVYALNTGNNQIIAYRADERFPVQSTMKLISVAALFKQSDSDTNLLQEKINYTKKDLIPWHPVTGNYINTGASLEALSEAAISYSDNTAVNLIIKKLGGPAAITAFAHSIGNKTFNVEHYDGELNSNPRNAQDTSTPRDMAISVEKLTLGNVLTQPQRELLVTWMRNNTTGYKRIRAAAPIGWVVAEKTGGGLGSYGIANDIGILWSPLCKPIVLAIYTVQNQQNAKSRDDIVASTASIILDEFAKKDECFKALFS